MWTSIWLFLPKLTDGAQHQTPVSSSLFSYRYANFWQTVYRRLGHIVQYARRPVRYVPLTATHCRMRLTWSREHALWTPQAVVLYDAFRRVQV
ncbi:transposable element Tcb2 transposase [Trichonephila clavipes]|nr:transposable element Tcb2 transposase [Trichonephila clavipes]